VLVLLRLLLWVKGANGVKEQKADMGMMIRVPLGIRRLLALLLASALFVGLSTTVLARPAEAAVDGTDWSAVAVPSGFAYGLSGPQVSTSCAPGTSFCMAVMDDLSVVGGGGYVGQGVLTTTDGTDWTGYTTVPSDIKISSLSCPAVDQCVAAGVDQASDAPGGPPPEVAETDDGGQTWTMLASPPAYVTVDASSGSYQEPWMPRGLSCPTMTNCYLVGATSILGVSHGGIPFRGVIATTSDAGDTWSATADEPTAAGDDYQLDAISCESVQTCVTVGQTSSYTPGIVLSSTDAGATWLSSPDPTLVGLGQLESVSCAGQSAGLAICSAVGYASNGTGPVEIRSLDGGVTWSGVEFTDFSGDGGGFLGGISCADADVCWAANGAGHDPPLFGTADGGTSWNPVSRDDATGGGGVVACATEKLCVAAVDGGLWVTTDGGGVSDSTPRAPVVTPLPPDSPSGVSAAAGRATTIGGQDRKAALHQKVAISIAEPGRKDLTRSTRVGLNGYFDTAISRVEAGRSSLSFSIAGKKVKGVTVRGFTASRPVISAVRPAMDPRSARRSVTITGRNFNKVTAVHFGSSTASHIRRIAADKITVTAPRGRNKTVLVTVTTSSGGPSPLTGRSRYTYR